MTDLDYKQVRKHYINSRAEEIMKTEHRTLVGNWRRAAKERACAEFDRFVFLEKEKALNEGTASMRLN